MKYCLKIIDQNNPERKIEKHFLTKNKTKAKLGNVQIEDQKKKWNSLIKSNVGLFMLIERAYLCVAILLYADPIFIVFLLVTTECVRQ